MNNQETIQYLKQILRELRDDSKKASEKYYKQIPKELKELTPRIVLAREYLEVVGIELGTSAYYKTINLLEKELKVRQKAEEILYYQNQTKQGNLENYRRIVYFREIKNDKNAEELENWKRTIKAQREEYDRNIKKNSRYYCDD